MPWDSLALFVGRRDLLPAILPITAPAEVSCERCCIKTGPQFSFPRLVGGASPVGRGALPGCQGCQGESRLPVFIFRARVIKEAGAQLRCVGGCGWASSSSFFLTDSASNLSGKEISSKGRSSLLLRLPRTNCVWATIHLRSVGLLTKKRCDTHVRSTHRGRSSRQGAQKKLFIKPQFSSRLGGAGQYSEWASLCRGEGDHVTAHT